MVKETIKKAPASPAKAAKAPKAAKVAKAMAVDYAALPQVEQVVRQNQERRKHSINTKVYKLRMMRREIGRLQTAIAASRLSEHDILPKVFIESLIALLEPINGDESPSFKRSGKRAMGTVGQALYFAVFGKYAHQLDVSERSRVTTKIAKSALQINHLSTPAITAETNPIMVLNHLKQAYVDAQQRNERLEKRMAAALAAQAQD